MSEGDTQRTERPQTNDPTDPDYWHRVAQMTVLEVIQELVRWLQEKTK